MATTTDIGFGERARDRTGLVLATGADRSRQLRYARRRTAVVRVLRWAFPLTTLLIFAGYGAIIANTAGWGVGLSEELVRKILPEDLAMNNPRYEGFGKDGSSYVFTAVTAEQDLLKPRFIKLNTIDGTIFQVDKTRTFVKAHHGVFDHEANVLELYKSIDVNSESGLKAKLTRATIQTKESVLTSNEPVYVEFPQGTVRSKRMTLRQKSREVTFADEVKSHLKPPPPAEGTAGAAATPPPAEATKQNALFTPSNGPIDIDSNRLDVNDNTKIAIYTGDVKAVQAGAAMTTPELTVTYEGGSLAGLSSSKGTDGAAADPANPDNAAGKVSRIVAKGPVVMTRTAAPDSGAPPGTITDTVTSDGADFDAQAQSGVLLGNVVMTSAPDKRVTCDRADLDQKADTALLTGTKVIVVQGENVLTGRRLFINRAAGRTQLTSPPGNGAGPGRVTARLHRSDDPAKPGAKAPEAKAADDQPADGWAAETAKRGDSSDDNPFGMTNFKTDPGAPVEVESDQLDVDDNAKVATFRGDVHAVQGDFNIKSAELYAYYEGGSGLADMAGSVTPKDGAAKDATAATKLSRIEAKRDVVVTSKDGQTATGDWANFDTKSNVVTLGGAVVLTRGQNVVKGTRLVIDMGSGQTTIDTSPPNTVALPSGGGWVTQSPEGVTVQNSGRASAVFFPQQLRDAKKAAEKGNEKGKKAPGEPAAAPDGWSATADPATVGGSGN